MKTKTKPKQLYVIPKNGLVVIDPVTRKPIHSQGQYVDKSTYWQRRILCGDVIQYGPEETREAVSEQPKHEVKEDEKQSNVGGDE